MQYNESIDSMLVDYIDEEPTQCMDLSEMRANIEAQENAVEQVLPVNPVIPKWILPTLLVVTALYIGWTMFFLDNLQWFPVDSSVLIQ
jgi:hypothetical protein